MPATSAASPGPTPGPCIVIGTRTLIIRSSRPPKKTPDVRFNTRIQVRLVANNPAPHSFAMSEEPRKRSRFDQTESDARPSRFDRRSRSPKNRNSEPRQRTRSPVSGTNSPASRDPAAAAAAAAAKINAQIQARKGIQHVDVPPIRSVRTSAATLSIHPQTKC